jgi:hypothetical protein
MEWLEYEEMRMEPQFAALLYHRQRPCANPAARAMMNKQTGDRVRAKSWQID